MHRHGAQKLNEESSTVPLSHSFLGFQASVMLLTQNSAFTFLIISHVNKDTSRSREFLHQQELFKRAWKVLAYYCVEPAVVSRLDPLGKK